MTVLLNRTLQILHIKSLFHRCTLATNSFPHNLNSVTHQPTTSLHFTLLITLTSSHDKLCYSVIYSSFSRPSWRLTHNWLQRNPFARWFSMYNFWSDTQETLLPTVVLLLRDVTVKTRRSRDPSPHLRNPSVYSCRLETGNVFTSALCSNGRGATLTARKTPLSLLLLNRRVYRGVV
jgi:hypothetical protein